MRPVDGSNVAQVDGDRAGGRGILRIPHRERLRDGKRGWCEAAKTGGEHGNHQCE